MLNDDRSFLQPQMWIQNEYLPFYLLLLHKDAIASPVSFAFYSNFIYFFLSPLVTFVFFPSFFLITSLCSYPVCSDLFCCFCLLSEAGSPLPQTDLEPVAILPQPPE